MVNTKQVAGRRVLKFSSIDQAVADARGLADSESAGQLIALGNWTLGQTFGHIAGWMAFGLDGYPRDFQPPWFIRVGGRLIKGRLLAGMPAGVRMPRIEGGTLCTSVMPTDDGLAALCRNWARLASEAPRVVNPVLGRLSHDEWIALNLRHAELHQGFFVPKS